MKHAIMIFFAAGVLLSCNDGTKEAADTKVAGTSDTANVKMDYAYTVEHPDEWVPGNRENTKMVLQSLKDFENGNMEACMKSFADSVHLQFDELDQKLSRDSVQKMFAADRKNLKFMKIDMHDFETVKSTATGKQYVSLWYVQKWEDLKGAMDSVSVMDDLEIKDGKIISIDEKRRRFPKK